MPFGFGSMTPQQLVQGLSGYTPDQLSAMPHALLYAARDYANPQQQAVLGPAEHQAFAREATQANPWMAAPIAAATPLYSLYKAFANTGARSPASLGEVGGGLMGVAQGLGLMNP
jgi:hypothetical protein